MKYAVFFVEKLFCSSRRFSINLPEIFSKMPKFGQKYKKNLIKIWAGFPN